MMHLEISKEEQQQLMTCLELAFKLAGGLQAASVLLPLAAKIQQLKDESDAGNTDA
jgi:hypothetical protein